MSNLQKLRADDIGQHRTAYDKNKKRILANHPPCAICGKPIAYEEKFPHPLSATVDHIIPISLGGHPSDISNLQPAHFCCNRAKADKLMKDPSLVAEHATISNRVLPQAMDWANYKGG